MYNYSKQNDYIFQQLISGMEKSMQATLNLMYARAKILDREYHRQEMEQMKKEIADDVLSRITATVDVSEIIMQIEELKRAIDSLGK